MPFLVEPKATRERSSTAVPKERGTEKFVARRTTISLYIKYNYIVIMVKKFDFVNKIVRQGNSLCVRIPSSIVKRGNLKEGMEANIIISPPADMYSYNEKNIQTLLIIANKVKKLDKYPEIKKRFFIMLNFEFLKETTSSDKEETEKKQVNFINHKKEEYGESLINEFVDFAMTFNKEAYTKEDDVAILKPKYERYLE